MRTTPFQPIITSLLEVDWYKFTMSYFIWRFYKNVRVRFAFKNRHAKRVHLPKHIRKEALFEQIRYVQTLRFTAREIAFLRESKYIPLGFFSEAFLTALQNMRLPDVSLRWDEENSDIIVEGNWWVVTFWETILMNIVNGLYYRTLAEQDGKTMGDLREEGLRRLMPKIDLLATRPGLLFAPFGLRRTVDLAWNREMESILVGRLPNQVVGVSNVRSAMELNLPPSGTCAHEILMVIAALHGACDDDGLREAPIYATKKWLRAFGPKWSVAIPDTFGSDSFLRDAPSELVREMVKWKIDSGDPREIGEKHLRVFARHEVDPHEKTLIFCDGLTEHTMIELYDHFVRHVGLLQGPGTHFSNDVGYLPVSMVVKAVAVLLHGVWVSTVKLSDSHGKEQGDPEEVARYERVFERHTEYTPEISV